MSVSVRTVESKFNIYFVLISRFLVQFIRKQVLDISDRQMTFSLKTTVRIAFSLNNKSAT